MSDPHSTTPPPPPTNALAEVHGQAQLSAALAVVLAVLLVGIAIYEYYRVTSMLAPENVADRVETAIQENYPEVRAEIVREVKSQAPVIAEQVSDELIALAPDARQRLEALTARQIDRAIAEGTEFSAEQFRDVLNDNRAQVVEIFETIEQAPENTHELVLAMEADLEQSLDVDVQRQAKYVLAAHRGLNDKLETLADPNAQLDPQELLERRIVRIVRAMQEAPAQPSVSGQASVRR
jgi:hypothetical protein